MATDLGAPRSRPVGERYLALIRRFPLRPLFSDAELDQAIAVVDSLLAKPGRDADEEDYLDVLGDIIHKYESQHHSVAPVSDAEMLRFLITDAKGVTQAQVAAETGIPESTISEVLSGKRGLSRRNIGILSRYFNVSPSVFSFG